MSAIEGGNLVRSLVFNPDRRCSGHVSGNMVTDERSSQSAILKRGFQLVMCD